MSDSSEEGDGVDADVPDAVLEWLRSVADERDVSEAELLQSLLSAGEGPSGEGGGVAKAELERVDREFRELVEDVRERIVQVKRETDEKAPVDHTHHELKSTIEDLGHEVGTLESRVNEVDERLAAGFENYEEILTYLTETTDALDRNLGRLAAAVMELRERVGDATRDEVRRTALAHLTDTANRHGVEKAKCEECGEGVHVGMLVEPQCPHCESSFSSLEPKSGFFRSSVLHTGTMPALESGPEEAERAQPGDLETMVEEATAGGGSAPDFDVEEVSAEEPAPGAEPDTAREPEPAPEPASPDTAEAGDETAPTSADGGDGETAAVGGDGGETTAAGGDDAETAAGAPHETDGQDDLQRVDGIGSAYSQRLREAGVDDLLSLAIADPVELGETIDVPPSTVAEWVDQADGLTGT